MSDLLQRLFELDSTTASVLGVIHLTIVVSFVLVERRQPAATLAWVLALIYLPVIGVVAYVLFGPRRLVRRARRHANVIGASRQALRGVSIDLARSGPARTAPPDDHSAYQLAIMRLNERLTGAPVTPGNSVIELDNAKDTYDALHTAIAAATDHIHALYYIVQPDEVGVAFRDALTERAADGVTVRVLVDAIGSMALPDDFWQPLIDAGGRAETYGNPSLFARFRNSDRVDFRNHRKILVADGRVGFFGGINIGREYLGLDESIGAWRDTHAQVEGPAVFGLQATFIGDWLTVTGEPLTQARYYPADIVQGEALGACKVQIVASGPDRRWSPTHHVFFQAIALAEHRVHITSPYFVPDVVIQQSLLSAALRGVDVRLLLPGTTDNRLVRWAGQSYYMDLLDAGVRIFEYDDGFIHAKTMVVDDWFATIGSANIDVRSLKLNYEVGALVFDTAFCNELAETFEGDLRRARRIDQDGPRRWRIWQRLIRSVSRLLSPLL